MEDFLNRLSRFIVRLSVITGCCFLVLNIADITVGIIARQTAGISLVWT